MEEAAVNQLLASLTAGETGWGARVPAEAGLFLGHPVGLDIQSRDIPEDGPPPRPDVQKLALARQVLASLPQVPAVAEREYTAREGERGGPALLSNPHIWLPLDESEEDGPGWWTFVVGRQDWPDHGVHVEYDGLEFLECWGGD